MIRWTPVILLLLGAFLLFLVWGFFYFMHLQNDCIPPSFGKRGDWWELWKYICP
jgi:hypothetical protein